MTSENVFSGGRDSGSSTTFNRERRTVLIEGAIKDAPGLVPNNAGDKFRFNLTFRKVTRLITAELFAPELPSNETSHSYPFGAAIQRNGSSVPEKPRKESIFYDAVQPAYAGLDYDFEDFESWRGDVLLLVEHTVPRRNRDGETYPVRKRHKNGSSPDAHDSLNQQADSRGRLWNKDGEFEYLRDGAGEIVWDNGRPLFIMDGIGMWDEIMLPMGHDVDGAVMTEDGAAAYAMHTGNEPTVDRSVLPSAVASGEDANAAAKRLYDEFGPGREFRDAALAHPAILDPKGSRIKNDILMGTYAG